MFDRPRTRDSSFSNYQNHPSRNKINSYASVATATATTLVYQYHPGPHAVMPISAALSASPVASIVPDVQTVDSSSPQYSRSLTQKYIPPTTLTVPESSFSKTSKTPKTKISTPPTPSPATFTSPRSLWFQLSPIRLHTNHGNLYSRRQSNSLSPLTPLTTNNSPLSPISPILSSLPLPISASNEKTAQKGLTWRKTLLQRIEGWWDLGLLRNGTIKGRAGTSGSLATGNASILPMTSTAASSSASKARTPFFMSRANSRTDDGISMSPVAFV